MNRFEYCHPDNNSDNDSFESFLSKNRICDFSRENTNIDVSVFMFDLKGYCLPAA
jgi:hypothetical protein